MLAGGASGRGLRLITALAAVSVTGCAGQYHYLAATPLCDRLEELEPGVTTREDLRARLGPPWFTAGARQAEVYAGSAEFQEFVAVGLPVPAGKSRRPATLLAVYDDDGVLSGVEYSGPGRERCSSGVRRGDLRGLELQALDVVVAPPEAGADPGRRQPEAGLCLVVVDLPARVLRQPSAAWIYLDDRYLQHPPSGATQGFLRVPVTPGPHSLTCRTARLPPDGLPPPGHALPPDAGWRASVERLEVDCPADATRYFRLVNRAGSGIGYERCALEPLAGPPTLQGAREVLVPAPP